MLNVFWGRTIIDRCYNYCGSMDLTRPYFFSALEIAAIWSITDSDLPEGVLKAEGSCGRLDVAVESVASVKKLLVELSPRFRELPGNILAACCFSISLFNI
jgi:hypothetical protein